MTATELSPGYGKMLHEFLNGWTAGSQWYFVQHKEILHDGKERWWPERPVSTITDLCRQLKGLPASDNYVSSCRYEDPSPSHSTPVYTRGWLDFDFREDTEVSVFRHLDRLRRVQDELRDKDGRSPIVIIFTGRGFHLWFYLSEPVLIEVARKIRAVLEAVFDLKPDPKVPIEPHRQMRLPGFINGKTSTPLYCVWCTEQMSVGDVRRASTAGVLRWDPVHPKPVNYFLKLDPGNTKMEEHLARQRHVVGETRGLGQVDLVVGERALSQSLATQAIGWRDEGVSTEEIAIRLRRTRSDVERWLAEKP